MENYRRTMTRVFKLSDDDIDFLDRLAGSVDETERSAAATYRPQVTRTTTPVPVRGFEGGVDPDSSVQPKSFWVEGSATGVPMFSVPAEMYARPNLEDATRSPVKPLIDANVEFRTRYPHWDGKALEAAPQRISPRAPRQADLVRNPDFMASANTWIDAEYGKNKGIYRRYMENTPVPNGRDALRLKWMDPDQWSQEKKAAMFMDDVRFMKNNPVAGVASALRKRPPALANALATGFAAHESLQWGSPEAIMGWGVGKISDPTTYLGTGVPKALEMAVPKIGSLLTTPFKRWLYENILDEAVTSTLGELAAERVKRQGSQDR